MPVNNSRTRNSMLNVLYSLVGQIINILVKFGLRSVFIYTLGKEYLGLNGLFTNILTFLSLAELGVGASITFSLYEPIQKQDNDKIICLMRLYKTAYFIIGIIVLTLGCALTPFLNFFVAEMPDIPYIQVIYLLFVINSGISYFFSYKSTYITANQKNYIVTNTMYVFMIITAILQAVILLTTGSYIIFLIIQIAGTIGTYITISVIGDRMYPVLKKKNNLKLDNETKHTITDNMGAVIFHKLGGSIVFSTDNILLSKLFGLIDVGLYSNYTLIISTIERILGQFFYSITASVGNLRVSSDNDHQRLIYSRLSFIQFWIYSFVSVGLGILIDPFIKLWVGESFLMARLCVAFIVINFYIKGMRQVNQVFNQSYGLLRKYKYSPIPEVIINIVASIILAKLAGPAGVFIGTTVSTICVMFWKEPKVLFKYGFEYSLKKYYMDYCKCCLIVIADYLIITFLADIIPLYGISAFVVRFILVILIPNIIIILLFHKKPEFQYTVSLMKRIALRKGV